jgi:putative DNA primase/helicase
MVKKNEIKKNETSVKEDLVQKLVDKLSDSHIDSKSKHQAHLDCLVQTADFIMKDCANILIRLNHQWRVYNGKYWAHLEESEMRKFLREAAIHYKVPKLKAKYHAFQKDLLAQIESLQTDSIASKSDSIQINLRNGVLDLSDGTVKLLKHHPQMFHTHYLDYSYDPEARAPQFKNFLLEVLPNVDCRLLVLESIAAAFIPKSAFKLEKAFFYYGFGANGKSVFFDVIKALLGPDNMSFCSLSDLTDSKGNHRIQVQGKLLNYSSESDRKINPAIFKQIVSKEPTSGERKYKDPIQVSDHPHLVCNTNVIPNFSEGSNGLLRRVCIIPFSYQVPKEKRDPTLATKIIQMELSGVLNLIIEALLRLRKNQIFTESSEAQALSQEVKNESNSVRAFIDDHNIVVSQTKSMKAKELYIYFQSYCAHNGFRHTKSFKGFNRAFQECEFEKIKKTDGLHFKVEGNFSESASSSSLSS